MRFLVKVKPDLDSINKTMFEGTFDSRIQQVLSEIKPEAAYFLEEDGRRTAIFVVEIEKAAEISRVAEPFFDGMNSEVRFHPVMTAEDLHNSNFTALAKKWA